MMKSFLASIFFATTALAASRMTAPEGAIVVAKSGGDYDTVSAAVKALSTTSTSTQTIFIEEGTYDEQVYIPSLAGELIIYGQTDDTTSYSGNLVNITHNINLPMHVYVLTNKMGTVRNHSPNSSIYNLNIINTAGQVGHQALAVSAYGNGQGYYGCQFKGYQDTLLAQSGNQVYAHTLIEGAVDFIFGQHARAWFHDCDIRVLKGPSSGYITANGRSSETDISYYVIHKSNIAAASGNDVPSGTYYLGRPWSQYARVLFQKTSMSDVINSAGWSEWSTTKANTDNVTFAEYGNTGAGAKGKRASFSEKLNEPVSISTILGSDWQRWADTSYIN
ncbi:pectin lyase fold/virulence factor [Aspergillus alliaceus]|uniref:Pectinesterase n=1 Tax=Petromyces alliaceus TaxID=209559 RepID=A0A5N7BZH7_PETAA|nr:pectin lyase fold/virulence factor [Aspergillus alliaceus]KAB8228440.1 pectin lyase fold/virulence factor [Aspergillus alliaceus]KAE8387244.1 pectin lyase fold/virulence factor [Aspergillus alliaceus]